MQFSAVILSWCCLRAVILMTAAPSLVMLFSCQDLVSVKVWFDLKDRWHHVITVEHPEPCWANRTCEGCRESHLVFLERRLSGSIVEIRLSASLLLLLHYREYLMELLAPHWRNDIRSAGHVQKTYCFYVQFLQRFSINAWFLSLGCILMLKCNTCKVSTRWSKSHQCFDVSWWPRKRALRWRDAGRSSLFS